MMSFHLVQVLMVWLTIPMTFKIRRKREFSSGESKNGADWNTEIHPKFTRWFVYFYDRHLS